MWCLTLRINSWRHESDCAHRAVEALCVPVVAVEGESTGVVWECVLFADIAFVICDVVCRVAVNYHVLVLVHSGVRSKDMHEGRNMSQKGPVPWPEDNSTSWVSLYTTVFTVVCMSSGSSNFIGAGLHSSPLGSTKDTQVQDTQQQSTQRTSVPTLLHEQQLRQEHVLAPDMQDVMYPADVLQLCPCGWANLHGCFIPDVVCQHGLNVLQYNALLADGSSKKSAWTKLCASIYTNHDDIVNVLQILADLSGPILSNCSARELSTTWGLLAPQQEDAWYTGGAGKNERTNTWAFGAQNLASTGSGGLRLGMLSPNAPISMQEHMQMFDLGESLQGTMNTWYKHTIAQSVCNKTLQTLLREELNEYFVDTLIPMEHSVQIVPAVDDDPPFIYCVRWVIEYAMFSVLMKAEEEESLEERQTSLRVLVVQQQAIADEWLERCSV